MHMAQLMPLWTNVDDKMTVKDCIFFYKTPCIEKNTLNKNCRVVDPSKKVPAVVRICFQR